MVAPKTVSPTPFIAFCDKSLPKTVKKCKVFEMQKLTKLIKKRSSVAVTEGTDVEDLNILLQAIKETNPIEIIHLALHNFASLYPSFKPKIKGLPPVDTATMSVHKRQAMERLANSKALKQALEEYVPTSNKKGKGKMTHKPSQQVSDEEVDTSRRIASASSSSSSSSSISTSDSEDETNTKAQQRPRNPKKTQVKLKTNTSTFLPSLSAGFTLGSDEEGDSDIAIEDFEPARKPPKRLGQRQRRALWEKQYGSEANHLKASREAEQQAKAAILAKQKARMSKRKRAEEERQQRMMEAQKLALERPVKKVRKEGPTHASWEAKKKQRELASAAVTGQAPQGKKITFD